MRAQTTTTAVIKEQSRETRIIPTMYSLSLLRNTTKNGAKVLRQEARAQANS